MKKPIIAIILALCAAILVFVACSNHATPDEADPIAALAATATPEPTPEPTQEPELHFDDLVTQYESSNDIDLNTSVYLYQWEFFNGIYAQNYTGTDAINDMEVTSEENKPLLDLYINKYLADLHDGCDFDDAVNEFIQSNPDVDISQDLTPLFNYILEEGIDPSYIQDVGCNNQYAKSFIKWYESGGEYNPYEIEGGYIIGEGEGTEGLHTVQFSEEQLEEIHRQHEEFVRQAKEAAAAADEWTRQATERAIEAGTPYGWGNNF